MRSGEAEDAPNLPAPCQRQEGELELLSRMVTALGEGGRAGSELATAQFLLKPVGFCSCHRHRSSHILSRPKAAFQPSSCSASAGSA